DPIVRTVVARVTRRRLAVIEAAFRELGHSAEQARHRATAIYSAYLGTTALRRVDAAPADREGYITTLLPALGVAPKAQACAGQPGTVPGSASAWRGGTAAQPGAADMTGLAQGYRPVISMPARLQPKERANAGDGAVHDRGRRQLRRWALRQAGAGSHRPDHLPGHASHRGTTAGARTRPARPARTGRPRGRSPAEVHLGGVRQPRSRRRGAVHRLRQRCAELPHDRHCRLAPLRLPRRARLPADRRRDPPGRGPGAAPRAR